MVRAASRRQAVLQVVVVSSLASGLLQTLSLTTGNTGTVTRCSMVVSVVQDWFTPAR